MIVFDMDMGMICYVMKVVHPKMHFVDDKPGSLQDTLRVSTGGFLLRENLCIRGPFESKRFRN